MSEVEQRGGFTTIEVVATLVIVGVLIAVAVTRLAGATSSLDTEAEILRSHLRYAQSMAMANNVAAWTVNIGANSYALLKDGAPASLPAEDANTHTFSGGVAATPLTLTLDEFGSPGVSDIPITLSSAGRTVVVTTLGGTGFIQ